MLESNPVGDQLKCQAGAQRSEDECKTAHGNGRQKMTARGLRDCVLQGVSGTASISHEQAQVCLDWAPIGDGSRHPQSAHCRRSPGLRLAGGLRDCIHLDKKMLETKRVLAKEMLHEQAQVCLDWAPIGQLAPSPIGKKIRNLRLKRRKAIL